MAGKLLFLIPIIILLEIFFIKEEISAQTYSPSFFVVHCDPTEPYNFPNLVLFVEKANTYKVPLTIEFTPPWADSIKSDPQKMNYLKLWQNQGHEIGVHHHGITAKNYWDGYTNYPPDSIIARGWPLIQLKGNMLDFFNKLSPLGGDSLILTCGTEDLNEWVPALKYQTTGTFTEDAFSIVQKHIVNGKNVYEITHTYIGTQLTVNALIKDYPVKSQSKITGVVCHVWNYVEDSSIAISWLKFISGKNCKTVRQIIRERVTSVKKIYEKREVEKNDLQIYPNPIIERQFNVKYSIPADEEVEVIIYDVIGREIQKTKMNLNKEYSEFYISIGSNLTKGIYLIRVLGKTLNLTNKFILKK